jgi:DNA-nicking Smr family endonuclease
MSKHKLDLHPIFRNSKALDEGLKEAVKHCHENGIRELEIIHGKGSGQLKKRVLRFLQQKEIKKLYKRIDKDSKNFGRTFVYFK